MSSSVSEVMGEVIGWVLICSFDDPPQKKRLEFSTLESWREHQEVKNSRGTILYTRISGPNGVEEKLGALSVPLGTKMIRLACNDCEKESWYPYPFYKKVTKEECDCCGGF